MIIYTNYNNSSTLKLLIAAKLENKAVKIQNASLSDSIFQGVRQLPLLEVNEDLKFFSSNAATVFLLPPAAGQENWSQHLEWEATRLYPAVVSVLTSKTVSPELKQLLLVLLQDLDKLVAKSAFVLGDKISAVDVALWSTLYLLVNQSDLSLIYLADRDALKKWFQSIAEVKEVQEALSEWSSKGINGALSASPLGIPQIGSLTSPICSPDEGASGESGPSADELEAAHDGWLHGHERLPELLPNEPVILPKKGRRNILITSALPYVNNVPHLGNIIGCVLSADIYARYCRTCQYNTLFICGTDEYGTATETKALEENLTPQQICDKYFEIHNTVYRWFGIGFDHFGRTTFPEQTELVQKMFLKLNSNGFVSTQPVEQLLCKQCDRFLADRFVEGTCPHPGCGYEGARGDQCDKCGKLVNATELINARCKICASPPELTTSTQFFLELPQLEPSLRSWSSRVESGWSSSARAVARAWLRDGLRSRCVTRDLKWGIPVPLEGFQKKVFYVWFDAPIGYISITKRYTDQYEQWWLPKPEHDVQLVQFMAKDNVPFHAIMFPAVLMGINLGHVLVKHIMATEYLNYEEGKFSKSRGVGVFGTDAQDTGIPADVWRFYLASVRPEGQDSSFSWLELFTRHNSELLNNLGNFCHRTLSFCSSNLGGVVPEIKPRAVDIELLALVNREIQAYISLMEKGRLRDALRHVLSVSRLGNQHMQSEQPWVLLKGNDDDKERAHNAIGMCCQLVTLLATLLAPYMPNTARNLKQQLAVDDTICRLDVDHPQMRQFLPRGHKLGKPEPLFTKLEVERVDELKKRYAGTQGERALRNDQVNGRQSVSELEEAVAKQGEKVRTLKQSKADKLVWQPEVTILLDLKKQLAAAIEEQKSTKSAGGVEPGKTAAELQQEVAKQDEKVRALKQSKADKSVWQPEMAILCQLVLQLKKQRARATVATPVAAAISSTPGNKAELEDAVTKQAEKVRTLKQSTKDKSVWQPEVDILLDLMKKLSLASGQPAAAPVGKKNKRNEPSSSIV